MRTTINRPGYLNKKQLIRNQLIVVKNKGFIPNKSRKTISLKIVYFVYCPIMGLIHTYKEIKLPVL